MMFESRENLPLGGFTPDIKPSSQQGFKFFAIRLGLDICAAKKKGLAHLELSLPRARRDQFHRISHQESSGTDD